MTTYAIREHSPGDEEPIVELSLRSARCGMRVAFRGTGGDEGHTARCLYDRAGFTRFPVVQYFKAL